MAQSFNKFNNFVQSIGKAEQNLNSDTLKIILTNTAPNAADTVYNGTNHTLDSTSSAAELAAGNGYSAGGTTVASTAYSQSSGTAKLTGNAVVFTASGSVGPFRYAVLYNSTGGATTTRPLIGWWDYASSITLANGETFTVNSAAAGNWDSSNPILSIT